jgi:hypothetical protein
MGAGASIPETEEQAREQGYTDKQIEEYKVLVVALARQNAQKALQTRRTLELRRRLEESKAESKSQETKEEFQFEETKLAKE